MNRGYLLDQCRLIILDYLYYQVSLVDLKVLLVQKDLEDPDPLLRQVVLVFQSFQEFQRLP